MGGSDEVDLFLFYSLPFHPGINPAGLDRERPSVWNIWFTHSLRCIHWCEQNETCVAFCLM